MGGETIRGSRSLRNRLVILMVLTATVGLMVATPAFIAYTYESLRADAGRELETTSRVIADNTTAALTFGDARTASELLAALRAKPAVTSACLYRYDSTGKAELFAQFTPNSSVSCHSLAASAATVPTTGESGIPLYEEVMRPGGAIASGHEELVVSVPVTLDTDNIGALRVTQSLQYLDAAMRKQAAFALLILAISVALSFFTALRTQSSITKPILKLAETAQHISQTNDYSLRAPVIGHDELGGLAEDFNRMLMQISAYDAEVQQSRRLLADEVEQTSAANNRLQSTLLDLRRTQAQLVQSEKMASLGGLVAGVAHEINTPVGVGVTAASTLAARAAQIREQYDAQTLKRSDLERFLEVSQQSCDILLKNLQRAADLISSFKRVAVDQSSDERRKFGLRAYINETLMSLAPTYRKQGHVVSVEQGPEIEVDSYPGALAQIVTNLVSNSLVHAFEAGHGGHMEIELTTEGEDVVMRYADDGKGIPEEYLGRVFDPFFTTKRGSGGSGLGMHIVFNLVSQQLGGTITVGNAPGGGAEFIVRFPRHRKGE